MFVEFHSVLQGCVPDGPAELRERRRSRLEAMGLRFEETPLPPDCTGPRYDLAKVLRMRPRRDQDSRKPTVD